MLYQYPCIYYYFTCIYMWPIPQWITTKPKTPCIIRKCNTAPRKTLDIFVMSLNHSNHMDVFHSTYWPNRPLWYECCKIELTMMISIYIDAIKNKSSYCYIPPHQLQNYTYHLCLDANDLFQCCTVSSQTINIIPWHWAGMSNSEGILQF